MFEIVYLPKEKYKGTPVPLDYRNDSYYDLEISPLDDRLPEVKAPEPAGIDRIVPMGKSMDFSLIWDGYDLIRQMSRRITIL